MVNNDIRIVRYDAKYIAEFQRLNREWLEGFQLLEPADEVYLNAPQEMIIEQGGGIFFALDGDTVLGTCSFTKYDTADVYMENNI